MNTFALHVNRRTHSVQVEPDTPVLDVLRDDLEIKGPRFGCGLGQCGACTVIAGGAATRSFVHHPGFGDRARKGDGGRVTDFSGHVELGTGVETALAQIVADELDVPVADIDIIRGNTWLTPDQGPTWGSLTVQAAGQQLRQAAACARRAILGPARRHPGQSDRGIHRYAGRQGPRRAPWSRRAPCSDAGPFLPLVRLERPAGNGGRLRGHETHADRVDDHADERRRRPGRARVRSQATSCQLRVSGADARPDRAIVLGGRCRGPVSDLAGALDASGNVAAWEFTTWLPSRVAGTSDVPLLAPSLIRRNAGLQTPADLNPGTMESDAKPSYAFANVLATVHKVATTPFRPSWLRGPGRMPSTWADECFMDELAAAAGTDPVAFHLKHLRAPRGAECIDACAKAAGWQPRASPRRQAGAAESAKGRGFPYVFYDNSRTYVAAVCEVEMIRSSGQIRVTRFVVAHDCGLIVNPDDVKAQIDGGITHTLSRTLIDRPDKPSWGAGEPTCAVVPPALGNAVYDAIGVRLRTAPSTPERVKAAQVQGSGAASKRRASMLVEWLAM